MRSKNFDSAALNISLTTCAANSGTLRYAANISPNATPELPNSGGVSYHTPTMIRASSARDNSTGLNIPAKKLRVELVLKSNIMDMTVDWSEEEKANERRLVLFNFDKISSTCFEVTFRALDKAQFSPNLPVISCIYWREADFHIVTSVDIVLILEFLIHQSFSIEEKNRIRRNLQSLKPFTISRTNKSYNRFFALLMKMEDPRPRNIEKDLKVFMWKDVLRAIQKVISKYTPNLEHKENLKHVEKITEDRKLQGENFNEITYPGLEKYPDQDSDVVSINNTKSETDSGTPDVLLPSKRLKLIGRKNNQNSNINQVKMNDKGELFNHALKPTDPVPLDKRLEKTPISDGEDALKRVSVGNTTNNLPSADELVSKIHQIPSLSDDCLLLTLPYNNNELDNDLNMKNDSASASPSSVSIFSNAEAINSGQSTKATSIVSRTGSLNEDNLSNKPSHPETLSQATNFDLKSYKLSDNVLDNTIQEDTTGPFSNIQGNNTGEGSELLNKANIELDTQQNENSTRKTVNPQLTSTNPTKRNGHVDFDTQHSNAKVGVEEKSRLPHLSSLLPMINSNRTRVQTQSVSPSTMSIPSERTESSKIPSALPLYSSPGLFFLPKSEVPSFITFKHHKSE